MKERKRRERESLEQANKPVLASDEDVGVALVE